MVWPKVSFLWVNFNSSQHINVILDSLNGLKQIDYPNYEVILVDNGSHDSSPKAIRRWVESSRGSHGCFRFYRLEKNLGYTGGNNFAFKLRDSESKYIVLVNNDFVPTPESLKKLVEICEQNDWIGGLQGIIKLWESDRIENMGLIVDPFLISYAIYGGCRVNTARKSKLCTFLSGAFSLYKISCLKNVLVNGNLFDEHMFAYYDDMILGMRLWMYGYKLMGVPIVSGRHYSSLSFGKISPFSYYLSSRGIFVLNRISINNRYKIVAPYVNCLRKIIKYGINNKFANINEFIYVLYRSWMISNKLSQKIDYRVDLSRIPIIKTDIGRLLFGSIKKNRWCD